jgi:NitT/TauT family transport system permease protein
LLVESYQITGWPVIFQNKKKGKKMRELFTPYARASDRQLQIAAIAITALLLLLWSLKLDPLIPTPIEVWEQWKFQTDSKGLLYEMWVSFKLNMEALAYSAIITAVVSYGQVIPIVGVIVRFMEGARLISAMALAFPIMFLIKDPHTAKVVAISFGMIPYLLTGLASAVRSVGESQINHARTIKLGHWGTTWQVIIRGRLFDLIESIRQNFTIGWLMTVGVEAWVRSEGGVGLMIVEQQKYMKLADMFAIMLTIFVVGMLQDQFFRFLQRWLCPYATIGKGAFS